MFNVNNEITTVEKMNIEPCIRSTRRINNRETEDVYSDGTCIHYVLHDDGNVVGYKYKLSKQEMQRMDEELRVVLGKFTEESFVICNQK